MNMLPIIIGLAAVVSLGSARVYNSNTLPSTRRSLGLRGSRLNGDWNNEHRNSGLSDGQLTGRWNDGQLTGRWNDGQLTGRLNNGHLNGRLNDGHLIGRLNDGHLTGRWNDGQLTGRWNDGQLTGRRNDGQLTGRLNRGHQDGALDSGKRYLEDQLFKGYVFHTEETEEVPEIILTVDDLIDWVAIQDGDQTQDIIHDGNIEVEMF
ncbi:Hypothetical predicted protein [Mytilus galloprovincialis]|uniref:Uncharacterized protein n=1 Tax=Mytilus galloprovincialis TaxID=29158 RepID=A0A8B6G8Y9_MYTGA|nr:Hypothetical predicted protein [Mytilus galloprovincialis]